MLIISLLTNSVLVTAAIAIPVMSLLIHNRVVLG